MFMQKRERVISRIDDDALLLPENFDEALMGPCEHFSPEKGQIRVACYDQQKILEILSREMPPDDAREYMDYNILGSCMGSKMPVFLDTDAMDLVS
jgi:hypothetical protein